MSKNDTINNIVQQKELLRNVKGIVIAQNESDPYGIDSEVTRLSCGHVIGRDGMKELIEAQISTHQNRILCPFHNHMG